MYGLYGPSGSYGPTVPAEGVHFSALADSRVAVPHASAAKLGAVLVDLPYFERFPLAVARYLLSRPPAHSRWGDVTHHRAPIAVGRGLAEEAARLGGEDGAWLHALALGYISHAAVDRTVHPHVNSLAAARAARLGDAHARQHVEVEKYQSIMFHDARMGFEVMGTRALYEHCAVEAAPLWIGRTGEAVQRVLLAAWGEAPSRALLRGWARGYAQYVWVIASPLGARVAPREEKERLRGELFDGFNRHFDAAVVRSRAWMTALDRYSRDGLFDESARAELERVMPEGTIDPPPL